MIDAKNFDDDPLRLLRAVRFATTLGFAIDAATVDAVRARAVTINSVARERIEYELSVIFSAGAFRRALQLLRATALDVPLFGNEMDASRFHADDLTLAGAYAVLGHVPPGPIARDIATLQHLVDHHDRIALYDAGERIASQLPPLLRALGRDDRLDLPDFSIRALLDGDAIAALTALPPGPRLGEIKRALLEAQIRGEIATREQAEAFVRDSSH
jgi:tRNA nucleotidyltransferase/poly(A) polymerase